MSRLIDLCERINMGQSPDSASYNTVADGLPFFQGNADFGKKHPVTRVWCNAPAKTAQPADILISVRAPIGALNIADQECCIGRGLAALTVNESVCDRMYLWFALQSKVDELNAKGTGSTFKAITKTALYDTEIPAPPLDQQSEIAAKFLAVQEGIDCCTTIIEKLDLSIKAKFVEMFGEPIANPMGWPVKRLKEISVRITNGATPKGGSENYVESGIMFLRSQNVWRNRIVLDDVAYIDEATHAKMKKSSLHYKDILITKTGRINTENSSLGRAALFLGEDNSANINGHVYLVRLDGSVVPEFVVTILTGEAYRKYIRKVCVGGIDKRQINVDHVEDFPIIQPPIEMQEKFASYIEEVNGSKAIVQPILDKLKVIQASLTQEYFG